MKQKKVLYSAFLASSVISVSIMYDIFDPFDPKAWQKVGTSTYNIIEEIRTGYTPADKEKIARIQAYPPLEWARKQATYDVAVLAVQTAQEVADAARHQEKNDTHLNLLRSEIAQAKNTQQKLLQEKEQINQRVKQELGMAQAKDHVGYITNATCNATLQKITIATTFDALERDAAAGYQAKMALDNKEHALTVTLKGNDEAEQIAQTIIASAIEQCPKKK